MNILLPLQFAATLCAALFAGAALYINLVEHPARMATGVRLALGEWSESYPRATLLQAPLAVAGSLAGLFAWALGGGTYWLAGGILLGLAPPYTLLAMMSVNRQLLAKKLDKGSGEARRLLERWNTLHMLRTLLGLAALVTFILALL